MMSSIPKKNNKSGIPVVKHLDRDGDEDREDLPTDRSQSSNLSSHRSRDASHQQQQLSQHPLSKAMAKKPKKNKNHNSAETWIDEKIESQSQKNSTYSHSEQRRRREDMEKQLKEAEAQLSSLTGILEKREKLMKEQKEKADKESAELEQKVADKDGLLIQHGIDPVTGEKVVLDEEGQKKVESTKKFTKKRIQEMREKLRQMNQKTESFLSDIENTMHYLESLDRASERAGPLSEETQKLFGEMGSEEDIIAKVYGENQQPASIFAPAGKESPVQEDGDEEEEEKDLQFFITHVDEGENNPNDDNESDSQEANQGDGVTS